MNRRLATIPGAACPGAACPGAACFAVGLALLTLAGAVAAEPSPPGLAQSVADLRDEVRALRDSVAELRQGIEAQRKGRGDLQPVTMQIVSADEKPLAGYRVELESLQNGGPRILATGVSDDHGIAIDARRLPYGDYRVLINEPSGWRASLRRVTIEFGQPLEMRIPAPDPTLTGSLRLRCELSAERLRGLPFGLPQQRAGSGYFVAYAPEPSERSDRGDLPTIDHGLTVAAATARVYAERSFKLPDDSRIEWTWLTPLPDYRVTTAATVTSRPTSHDERWAPPRPNGAYYGSSEANEYVRVLVENRRVAPTAEVNLGTGTVELAVPAGQVGVTLRQLEAMADAGVVAAFGMPARRSVWLLASFRPDSEWPEYIFDLRGWEPSANSNTYAVKKVSVDPGETVEVVIRSPQGE